MGCWPGVRLEAFEIGDINQMATKKSAGSAKKGKRLTNEEREAKFTEKQKQHFVKKTDKPKRVNKNGTGRKKLPGADEPVVGVVKDVKMRTLVGEIEAMEASPDDPEFAISQLNPAQLHFCRRYAVHGSGVRASREAGFNPHYYVGALKNDFFVQVIDHYKKKRANKFNVDADRVIAELCKVAFSNIGDFVELQRDGTPLIDCTDVGPEELAAVSEITQDTYYEGRGEEAVPVKKTKIKFHNKISALEQLSRVFRLFGNDPEKGECTPEMAAEKVKKFIREAIEADGV